MKDLELWRVEYRADAYRDQTGKSHWGTTVFERLPVTDTGERFDHNDGYSVHKNHGRIYQAEDGRRFKVWTNTVDYSGGTAVVPEKKPNMIQGHWSIPPVSTKGFVDVDGHPMPDKEQRA